MRLRYLLNFDDSPLRAYYSVRSLSEQNRVSTGITDKIQVSVDDDSILNLYDMDKISGLPDDLLVKILSNVSTKEAVSTCILSKRWEFLWMWLRKLEFSPNYADNEPVPALCVFINNKLTLHRAPIIESLHLRLGLGSRTIPEDVKRWVEIAVSRHVRDLKVSYYSGYENVLPSSIFTCKSLVILKLKYVSLMDAPSMVSLPSLKTLQLKHVAFGNKNALQQLLSSCPILEDLLVYCDANEEVKIFSIIVPSLQSLSLSILHNDWPLDGYEIDTPSLKYLKLEDWSYTEHYSLIKNMPMLREAFVDISDSNLQSVIGSITSVKRLTICCCSKDVYGGGYVFRQLEHLKLCVCTKDSLKLLGPLLSDSPKLRELELFLDEDHWVDEPNDMVRWIDSGSVPKCWLSSLQTFKWSYYLGRPQDKDTAVYILKNARHLKTATISIDTSRNFFQHLQMMTELTFSPRVSGFTFSPNALGTCQLVFAEELDDIET